MIASELIEELSKYPAYVPVQVTANHIEIEELRFEGNYIELRVDAEIPSVDPHLSADDSLLEEIDALITGANWMTGKKAELRELVKAIHDKLAATF